MFLSFPSKMSSLTPLDAFSEYLSQFPDFSSESFDLVKPFIQEKVLLEGDYLLKQGQTCRQVAFIVDGLFRSSYLRDGKEITTCFCPENSITCSFESLISQQPSENSIQAIEKCRILCIEYESLLKLYEIDSFWQQVGRIAAEGEYLVTTNHNRFINDLSATDRYLQILMKNKELLQRVPLNYLASYIQVEPETLSRIRKKTARS